MHKSKRDNLISAHFVVSEKRETVSESERLLLGYLFRAGASAQSDLTSVLPLSQQSISRMSASLEARGMIMRGAPRQNGGRGQPSAMLEINPDYAATIGVSLMADGLTIAMSDFAGRPIAYKAPSCNSLKRSDVLKTVRQALSQFSDDYPEFQERLFGIGIAISGFRVNENGEFNTPESLEEFALVDLEDLFSNEFGLPAWADNDGNAATVAENMRGIGRRTSNFVYFYIATGVGGGVVTNGQLQLGSHGNAGEFVGILPPDKYVFPNLEILRQRINSFGVKIESVHELAASYDDAWPGIEEWLDEVAPSYSLMASAAAAVLDTEAIVLGGLMPKKLAMRLIPRIEFFDINRRGTPRQHASVVPAECEGDASAIGASLLPLSEKFFAF